MDNSSLILSSLSILGSISTAIVTVLSFKRTKKLENENILYKLKIEGYTNVMERLVSIVNEINSVRIKFEDVANENLEKYDVDAMHEDADKIDSKATDLIDASLKYSLIFPENILNKISAVYEFLYEDTLKTKDEPSLTLYLLKITDYYEQLLEIADKMQDYMRADLHSEKLNQRLFKRLK